MRSYYLDIRGNKKGPYSLNQLRAMWARGEIKPQNLYCEEGGDKWRKLELMQSVLETNEANLEGEAHAVPLGGWLKKLLSLFKS